MSIGTLTLGIPEMKGLPAASADTLSLAHGLARESRHPLSKALAAGLRKIGVGAATLDHVAEHPGQGLAGEWRCESLRLGSRIWCGVPAKDQDDGRLEIAFRRCADHFVFFSFEDQLRPEARETVAALRGRSVGRTPVGRPCGGGRAGLPQKPALTMTTSVLAFRHRRSSIASRSLGR